MRVIAGEKRRLVLNTPKGNHTRPTSDKIKETLFNILQSANLLYDARFMDLFSGSGGIGIEALSRGASFCAFCENSKEALSCIEQNLKHTGYEEKSLVFARDALSSLRMMEKLPPFDIIFMDPPYSMGYEREVLSYLSSSSVFSPKGLIIVEAKINEDFSYLDELGFTITRKKEYKTNMHVFISVG